MNNTSVLPVAAAPAGWVAEPQGRGTYSILWSSFSTIFLCSWTCLCLNIPSKHEGQARQLLRKSIIALWTFIGPEFVMALAIIQRMTVQRSVRAFKEAGYKAWTYDHAFYAEMGGIMLDTNDDFPVFPIDGQQLLYLVQHNLLDFPDIPLASIRDKNKLDWLLRVIALAQAVFFFVNICARGAQALAVTCLEVNALALLPCTLIIAIAWRHKPADVQSPTIIRCPHTISVICARVQSPSPALWFSTPLDFISRREWEGTLLWSHYTNIARAIGIKYCFHTTYPATRIRNTRLITPLKGPGFWFAFVVSLPFVLAMFVPWSFTFPTPAEQAIWRCATVVFCASFVTWSFWIEFALPLLEKPAACAAWRKIPDGGGAAGAQRQAPRGGVVARLLASIRNNSEHGDPALNVPASFVLPTYLFGFCYCTSRFVLLVLDFTELRCLPASAYQTVSWTVFFPQFTV